MWRKPKKEDNDWLDLKRFLLLFVKNSHVQLYASSFLVLSLFSISFHSFFTYIFWWPSTHIRHSLIIITIIVIVVRVTNSSSCAAVITCISSGATVMWLLTWLGSLKFSQTIKYTYKKSSEKTRKVKMLSISFVLFS